MRRLANTPCHEVLLTNGLVPSPDPFCLRIEPAWPDEACAFSGFLERATWDHYRTPALSDDEATAMQCFAKRLHKAVAEQGYAPR